MYKLLIQEMSVACKTQGIAPWWIGLTSFPPYTLPMQRRPCSFGLWSLWTDNIKGARKRIDCGRLDGELGWGSAIEKCREVKAKVSCQELKMIQRYGPPVDWKWGWPRDWFEVVRGVVHHWLVEDHEELQWEGCARRSWRIRFAELITSELGGSYSAMSQALRYAR